MEYTTVSCMIYVICYMYMTYLCIFATVQFDILYIYIFIYIHMILFINVNGVQISSNEPSSAQIASVLKTLKRLPRFKPSGGLEKPMKGLSDGLSTSFPRELESFLVGEYIH